MKPLIYYIFVSQLILLSACNNAPQPKEEPMTQNQSETMKPETKKLRHVVLFKFKSTSSAEDIASVKDAFSNLPNEISQIKDYEWGINNSPEGLDKGFTHCFFVTFDSEEDRAIYLPHPAHKAFVSVLEPHLDDVLVIDYWANEK
nr:Dabb family protein [Membranihabitans marinus]